MLKLPFLIKKISKYKNFQYCKNTYKVIAFFIVVFAYIYIYIYSEIKHDYWLTSNNSHTLSKDNRKNKSFHVMKINYVI